jgi:hypothetical protein
MRCEEPIYPAEQTSDFIADFPLHYECGFRMAVGSVAHIEKRCSCFIEGAEEHDDPALTRRQAALAAVVAFNKDRQHRLLLESEDDDENVE